MTNSRSTRTLRTLNDHRLVIFTILLIFGLIGLLSIKPSETGATTIHPAPTPIGQIILVNDLGDGANTGATTGCDADPVTAGDQCTLRAALQLANASAGDDLIRFDLSQFPGCPSSSCVIQAHTALPVITEAIDIDGPGAENLTVKGAVVPFSASAFSTFEINASGATRITGLTIEGAEDSQRDEALVRITSSDQVFIEKCVFTLPGLLADDVYNQSNGSISISDSTFSGGLNNGAIVDVGSPTIDLVRSTISGFQEFGVISTSGTLNIINSTITGNSTFQLIGTSGQLNIENSTIAGNEIRSFGAVVTNLGSTPAIISSSIIAANTCRSGNLDCTSESNFSDLKGTFTSNGHNVIGKTNLATITANEGDLFGATAAQVNIGPLQNNGGPTKTVALLPGSVAIDRGVANGLTTDQRGSAFPRINDDPSVANVTGSDGSDSGAFEVHQDTDGDGIVNALDPDDDNDGVMDANDAFPLDPTEWNDNDSDGIGDNADPDDDNDGVMDARDNCPITANSDQADFDLDGIGDVCDPATGPPVNKDQCKKGGWARFNVPQAFADENDCKKFVKGK